MRLGAGTHLGEIKLCRPNRRVACVGAVIVPRPPPCLLPARPATPAAHWHLLSTHFESSPHSVPLHRDANKFDLGCVRNPFADRLLSLMHISEARDPLVDSYWARRCKVCNHSPGNQSHLSAPRADGRANVESCVSLWARAPKVGIPNFLAWWPVISLHWVY